MRLRSIIFVCAVSIAFLILSASSVFACSCAINGTVDKEFAKSPSVVVLKVSSVEKLVGAEKGYGYGGIKATTLVVEKVFKGNFKVGDKLILAQGGGADCIWTFGERSVGEEYLFYLGSKPLDPKQFTGMIASTSRGNLTVGNNVWVASTCSRSGNVKYRTLDLKYLENISRVKGRSRLSGNISQRIESAIENGQTENKNLRDRDVRISGNGKDITLKTDENGDFELYNLPAGKYSVSVEPLAGYKTTPFDWAKIESINVAIKPNQHIEQDFEYYIDNSISGKFFDSNQRPLKDVCLDLYPADGVKAKYFHNFDCTNEDGNFKFSQIPAGRYIIVVNDKNEISARQPFGTFYYPDKIKQEEAQIITIGAGEHLKGLVIAAPTTAEVITVTGVLLFENGKPAVDESVEFYSFESLAKQKDKDYKTEDSRDSTDKDGQFEIRILKGQKGKLLGSMTTYEGEYENCPKLEILIRAKGPKGLGITDIETRAIVVDGVEDLTGVELKFPFPACKKSKID